MAKEAENQKIDEVLEEILAGQIDDSTYKFAFSSSESAKAQRPLRGFGRGRCDTGSEALRFRPRRSLTGEYTGGFRRFACKTGKFSRNDPQC